MSERDKSDVIDVEAKVIQTVSAPTARKPARRKKKSDAQEPSHGPGKSHHAQDGQGQDLVEDDLFSRSNDTRPSTLTSTGHEQGATAQDRHEDDLFADQEAEAHKQAILQPVFVISKSRRSRHFKKPAPLVHNKPQHAMTVGQHKLTNIFLRHATLEPQNDEGMWSIPKAEVLKLLGTNSRNNKYVEKILLAMLSIKVRWNVLEDGEVKQNYAVVFPFAQLSSATIKYKIEAQTVKFLAGTYPYANIDLEEQRELSKACSVPLYELASRYKNLGASRWFNWQELRDMLVSAENIPESAKKWSTFNERYLQPALKDVNARTQLFLTLETIVEGTAVQRARFIIDRQKNVLDESALSLPAPAKATLYMTLAKLGITERVASNLMKKYSEDEIKSGVEYTESRLNASHLKPLESPGRYLQNALKNGFHKRASDAVADLFADGSRKQNTNPQDVGSNLANSLVQKHRIMQVKTILAELDEAGIKALHDQYNAGISTPGLRIKLGRNKAGVLEAFQSWYAKQLWNEITDADKARLLESQLAGKKL